MCLPEVLTPVKGTDLALPFRDPKIVECGITRDGLKAGIPKCSSREMKPNHGNTEEKLEENVARNSLIMLWNACRQAASVIRSRERKLNRRQKFVILLYPHRREAHVTNVRKHPGVSVLLSTPFLFPIPEPRKYRFIGGKAMPDQIRHYVDPWLIRCRLQHYGMLSRGLH